MSPNFRCETGGVESVNNYKFSPTVDSLNDDKLITSNNLDFSGLSSSKINFSKKYSSILNEFAPSLEKNSNIEFKQRLNLMRIQSKLENNNKNNRLNSPNISYKLQDLKYNFFTKENNQNNYFDCKSPLRTISNIDNGCNLFLCLPI